MTYLDDDEFGPVTRITTGAVGEPGARVFLLQAQVEGQTVTWLMEKRQVAALGTMIPKLLERVRVEYPELSEPLVAARPNLDLREPYDPIFRVGDIYVEYDRFHDLVILGLMDADNEELADLDVLDSEEDDEEHTSDLQIFTTRGQALLLSQRAEAVLNAGRPACPQCGAPIDDFGHFCLPASVRWKADSDNWQ